MSTPKQEARPRPRKLDGPALLRKWARSAGRKQAEIAAHLGRSPSTVSLWLSGDRTPAFGDRIELHRLTGGSCPAWAWGTKADRELARQVIGVAPTRNPRPRRERGAA